MKELLADWKLFLTLGGGTIAAIALLVYAFVRPASDPEEAERKRRLHLNHIGRIAEGQVVELVEQPATRAEEKRGLLKARARQVEEEARRERFLQPPRLPLSRRKTI